jgi:hypothetical protein
MPIKLTIFLVFLFQCSASVYALDTGLLKHYLNIDMKLPQVDEAITPSVAVKAVENHIRKLRSNESFPDGLADFNADYIAVLGKWTVLSSAKPVILVKEDGDSLVARYLVGFVKDDKVGGFFSVDPINGSVQTDIMWTYDLDPLWIVPKAIWDKAATVNEIDELAELVPPFEQFTSGVPVSAHDGSLNFVDGVVDSLPFKTQEERKERVEWFNSKFGTEFKVQMSSSEGRRTATSKCMSVAASYVGDFWTVETGNKLPSYTNGVGGQKEYGHNPRLLECLFFENRNKTGLSGKWAGNFKTAPFGKDRVTGETIPFSPRGYSRVLVETGEGLVADNLVPHVLQYETNNLHFGMDQKPVLIQILTEGIFPGRTIKSDIRESYMDDFPFSLAPSYGEPFTFDGMKKALDTWGPMLGQQVGRDSKGNPRKGAFGMGVHCVMIVGTGFVNGKDMVIYKETFGDGSSDYLEDSFLGPAYRAMPLEYFYQGIAFPHHLYLNLAKLSHFEDASLGGNLTITTNKGQQPVDSIDSISIYVDGKVAGSAMAKPLGNGNYSIWIPFHETINATKIEIRAKKKYFADSNAMNGFGVSASRTDGKHWVVDEEVPLPIDMD